MRTRSTGRISPDPEAIDARERHRKRRASTSVDGGQDQLQSGNGDDDTPSAPGETSGTTTPCKTAKRVRFSDLGPELLSSTGLTPYVRRATLSPTRMTSSRQASPRNKRRFSLPPSLPSSSIEPLPSIEEIQYTPLKQVLEGRVRRRLRRSHLSEEINNIEAEQRADSSTRTELVWLRSEDAKKEERIKQLSLDLELQRQLGIEVNAEEEQELNHLKSKLAALTRGRVAPQTVDDTILDALPSPRDDQAEGSLTSPWEEETFFSSPTRHGLDSPLGHEEFKRQPICFDVSCQTSLPDHNHEVEIKKFESAVQRLTKESTDVKACLEMIWSELRNLGFVSDPENRKDMLQALRESFRDARLNLEYLLPGETSGGTNDGNLLLSSMVEHIKRLVEKASKDKKTVARLQQTESALRGQFNATVQKATDLEQRLSVVEAHRTELFREIGIKGDEVRDSELEIEEKAMEIAECKQRISQLEAEASEQSTSVDRLQAALITYRDEVTSLETLITKMEKETAAKDSAIADLQTRANLADAEREGMAQTLTKLRDDVQESAFELSALAKPGLKENVTRRPARKTDVNKRDSGISMIEEVGE